MNLALSLVCNLLAADVTIRIDTPTPTNIIITITLPEAQQVQVQTNVMRQMKLPPQIPDARASLPRSIPMPPMPSAQVPQISIKDWTRGDPSKFTWRKIEAPWLRELPGGTNESSYADHVRATEARASRGLRRGE